MAKKTKAERRAERRSKLPVPYRDKLIVPDSVKVYETSSWEDVAMHTKLLERQAEELRWLAQPSPPKDYSREALAEPILAIPLATRRWIVFSSLGLIGAVALAVTVVSLNDMAEGFQQALNLATWKAWILALLADILFIGVECLCIFAPREIVARLGTWAIRAGAILISMASNALSLSWIAPIPEVGVIAGVVMPLAIAGCTYTIGYAVHNGGR